MSILRFGCLAFDEGVSSSTKSSEYGSGRPEIAARNDETRGSFGCDAGYKKLWNLSVKVQTKANPCRANSIQQRQQAIFSIFKNSRPIQPGLQTARQIQRAWWHWFVTVTRFRHRHLVTRRIGILRSAPPNRK
jgi:hypothetical protein